MIGETFVCDFCKGTFLKAWSEEESQAEAEATWTPEEREGEYVLACDECWEILMRRKRGEA